MVVKSETTYQNHLMARIRQHNIHLVVINQHWLGRQGHPDLLVLGPNGRWGMLEVKTSEDAPLRPNQAYYVEHFNNLGFAMFIYPENEEEALHALFEALGA